MKTITRLEILNLANSKLRDLYYKEDDRYRDTGSIIAKQRMEKWEPQLKEMHDEILRLEELERKENV